VGFLKCFLKSMDSVQIVFHCCRFLFSMLLLLFLSMLSLVKVNDSEFQFFFFLLKNYSFGKSSSVMRTLAGMWVSSSVLLHLSFLFETMPSLLMHHLVHIVSISLTHTCMIENFLGPWFSYLGERLCFLCLLYVKSE